MSNPFDYVKSINEKSQKFDHVRDYTAYLTNQALSYSMDTIMFAQELNLHPNLPADCQYEFLYGAVRQGKRYSKWYKADEVANLELVMEHYKYSKEKAAAALRLLTEDQLAAILKTHDTGGR